jgi:hypothetical protein
MRSDLFFAGTEEYFLALGFGDMLCSPFSLAGSLHLPSLLAHKTKVAKKKKKKKNIHTHKHSPCEVYLFVAF